MEVLLKKDIEKLGYKDDMVNVKPGYGRNYLIPKGYAVLATESVRKMHTETLKQRAHKEEKIKNEAIKFAEQLKEMVLKVGAKVGENGKIFGSVNSIQVADAINKLGLTVDRKNVVLKTEPIKQIGKYEAQVRFHKEVIETVPFEVVEE